MKQETGETVKKIEVLTDLKALKPRIMAEFKVKEIGLFGSVLRGEDRDTGDIDVLVEFTDEAGLLDLVGLGLFLEEKFGRKVDVVSKGALRREIKESVLKEVAIV